MSTTNRPLAPYEEHLLAELREVITRRTVPTGAPGRIGAVRRPRLRVAIGIGAAAALALAATIAGPFLFGAEDRPAYAVERNPDGSIRVYIREYRDAKGLEARLHQLGVPAVVDYVPNGQQCREPRATYVPDDQVPPGLITGLSPGDPEGGYWKLHPDLIGQGRTFVYTTTIIGDPGDREWSARAAWKLAIGPVAACEPVPGPVLPRNGG